MRNTLKSWLATAIMLAVLFSYAGFSSCNGDKRPETPEKGDTTEVALLSDLFAYTIENEVVRHEPPMDSLKQVVLLKNLTDLHQSTRRMERKITTDTLLSIEAPPPCECCDCPDGKDGCCWCPTETKEMIFFTEPDSLITKIDALLVNPEDTLFQATESPIQVGGMELSEIRFPFSQINFNGEANLKITALVNGEPVEIFQKGNLKDGVWTTTMQE